MHSRSYKKIKIQQTSVLIHGLMPMQRMRCRSSILNATSHSASSVCPIFSFKWQFYAYTMYRSIVWYWSIEKLLCKSNFHLCSCITRSCITTITPLNLLFLILPEKFYFVINLSNIHVNFKSAPSNSHSGPCSGALISGCTRGGDIRVGLSVAEGLGGSVGEDGRWYSVN